MNPRTRRLAKARRRLARWRAHADRALGRMLLALLAIPPGAFDEFEKEQARLDEEMFEALGLRKVST